MSNLRDKYTSDEWNILEASLIGDKKVFERLPVDDEQVEKTDPIVDKVLLKFATRSKLGITKYGTTLQDNNASLWEWANHAQEEAMDMVLYLEKLKSITK